MMSCTPLRPRSTRWRRKADQPDLSSLAPSQIPRISRKPSELTALAPSRDIANLACPAALHHDLVEVEVGMLAGYGPVPPDLDLGKDLLVQFRAGGGAPRGAPKGFGDTLPPPDRYTGQVHLDQRFLDRCLPAPVALNDRRFKDLLA